jgi:hypothetical protein
MAHPHAVQRSVCSRSTDVPSWSSRRRPLHCLRTGTRDTLPHRTVTHHNAHSHRFTRERTRAHTPYGIASPPQTAIPLACSHTSFTRIPRMRLTTQTTQHGLRATCTLHWLSIRCGPNRQSTGRFYRPATVRPISRGSTALSSSSRSLSLIAVLLLR